MKKIFVFIVFIGMLNNAFARCSGTEWTYKWHEHGNNNNAIGCDCNENSKGYRIYERSYEKKAFVDGSKNKCEFPHISNCRDARGARDVWDSCSGKQIKINGVYGDIDSLPVNASATPYRNSGGDEVNCKDTGANNTCGWVWSCNPGFVPIKNDQGMAIGCRSDKCGNKTIDNGIQGPDAANAETCTYTNPDNIRCNTGYERVESYCVSTDESFCPDSYKNGVKDGKCVTCKTGEKFKSDNPDCSGTSVEKCCITAESYTQSDMFYGPGKNSETDLTEQCWTKDKLDEYKKCISGE